jgi:hypothetical protein
MKALLTLSALLLFASPVRAQVVAREVDDYVYGNYAGDFPSPPHADGSPRRAVIISWEELPFRFVFSHEASYCPWFELPSGAAVCYQFFEGNDGWAELFNQHGRMEKNSFVELLERGPRRVHVRWTYFGVNQQTGERAYKAVEDFDALPNGLVLRRQSYQSLLPGKHHGYAREPIELIGLCPVGKLWKDVLQADGERRHALAVLDPFSGRRHDVWWTPKPGTLVDADRDRSGAAWKHIDDAAGVVLAIPMRGGTPFVVFGAASGFDPPITRIKEHSFPDTGGLNWGATSWDHWPIGWLNSQAHPVDEDSLRTYPNHFAPAGMDLFALPNEQVERAVYWSLCGVGAELEPVRSLARKWLESNTPSDPDVVAKLPMLTAEKEAGPPK